MKTLIFNVSLLLTISVAAQTEESIRIEKEIVEMDSILFKRGYDQVDTAALRSVLHPEFEFYHDVAGSMLGPDAFVQAMSGLASMSYRAYRVLLEEPSSFHILRRENVVYGVIQKGVHQFYAKEESKEPYITSSAQFTHLWLLVDGQWKLKNSLSYDHVAK